MPLIAQLPPVVIGMEACGGAHEWARRFREPGQTVTWMAPPLVTPSVKSHTPEMADADAIGEVVWVGLKHDRRRQWLRALMQRRCSNRAVVALANTNARVAWVLLTTDRVYAPAHSAAEGRSEGTVMRTPATHEARGHTASMP